MQRPIQEHAESRMRLSGQTAKCAEELLAMLLVPARMHFHAISDAADRGATAGDASGFTIRSDMRLVPFLRWFAAGALLNARDLLLSLCNDGLSLC